MKPNLSRASDTLGKSVSERLQRIASKIEGLVSGRLKLRRKRGAVAGVCAGLGALFEVNPLIFRVAFLAAGFFTGLGLVVYALLAFVIPKEELFQFEYEDEAGNTWVEEFEPDSIELEMCDSCGATVKPGSRFCYHCGAAMK